MTRSYKDLDKSNCIQGGTLVIRGCNSYSVATGMGLYLFNNRGSGTDNFAHAVTINKQTFLMTDFEEFINSFTVAPVIPY